MDSRDGLADCFKTKILFLEPNLFHSIRMYVLSRNLFNFSDCTFALKKVTLLLGTNSETVKRILLSTISFAAIAVLTIGLLGSCNKENEGGLDAERVITVLGLNSEVAEGALVALSNGTENEVAAITLSGKTPTITTSLQGQLTAVYPSEAALFEENSIVDVKVPTVQTGSYSDANVLMAKMSGASGKTLDFISQTAIFSIVTAQDGGTGCVKISSSGPAIANTSSDGGDDLKQICVYGIAADKPDVCYIAILVPEEGLDVSTLTFDDGTNVYQPKKMEE